MLSVLKKLHTNYGVLQFPIMESFSFIQIFFDFSHPSLKISANNQSYVSYLVIFMPKYSMFYDFIVNDTINILL
jgi:hypothetical protein